MLAWSVLVAAILVFIHFVRRYQTHGALEQFQGPWLAGWSRLWLLRANCSGRMHEFYKDVNDKYGSTARIGPSYLITADPALIRRMNAARSTYTRARYYNALRIHPTRDNIVSIRDEKLHDELRYKMAPGYSGKENEHLEGTIDTRLNGLCDLITSSYITTSGSYKPVDLAKIITFFTLDSISDVAFGRTFGFLDRNEDPFGYIQQLKNMLPAMMAFAAYPELQMLMRAPFMQVLMPKAGDAIGIGKVMGFARDAVAERFPTMGAKEPQTTKRDMLGSFKAHGLSQEQLESETLTQITAGSDSTATAIRMTICHVATNPGTLEKLLQELEEAGYPAPTAGQKGSTLPIISNAEARCLPYLQACIKEGLRLYPPVTGLLSKQSPPEGDNITVRYPDGTAKEVRLPPGVAIGWNTYGMLRSKHLFGEDAELFRPERWLNLADPAQARDMDDLVNLVFGYGRFGCLGKSVAMLELNKAVPELLRRFKWQVVRPEKPWGGPSVGFWLQEDMWFVTTERTSG